MNLVIKSLVIVAGVVAIIGLIITVAVDMDNIYDVTLSILWIVTFGLAFAGALAGGKKASNESASAKLENKAGRTLES